MPVFESTEKMYEVLGSLFNTLMEYGDVAEKFNAAQITILFKINDRVIMNYYSAKRLAITLSQLIRRHEEQFGELELDVAKRRLAGQ